MQRGGWGGGSDLEFRRRRRNGGAQRAQAVEEGPDQLAHQPRARVRGARRSGGARLAVGRLGGGGGGELALPTVGLGAGLRALCLGERALDRRLSQLRLERGHFTLEGGLVALQRGDALRVDGGRAAQGLDLINELEAARGEEAELVLRREQAGFGDHGAHLVAEVGNLRKAANDFILCAYSKSVGLGYPEPDDALYLLSRMQCCWRHCWGVRKLEH